ncbi:uncharacterized protein L201_006347 [Kwoniella dendrophila CBS 6074]|uniref:SDE2-like domain-containing protein n=1 Tax=Kwoniella dendrophila CBS 6074 TaxID=1295534 RepID=A0AAX4K2K3_9TREE
MIQTVHLRLPSPLPLETIHVNSEEETTISDLLSSSHDLLSNENVYLRTRSSGKPLSPTTLISDLRHESDSSYPVELQVCVRLLGGKGGFGSQLRAAGGRMSSGKATNMDSCRDLSGRRLGTIKEAQRQAELLESEPTLKAKLLAEEKSKLESLERKLGISPQDNTLISENQGEGEGSSSKRKNDIDELNLEELASKKHKFEDNKFLEQSREINENVRNAVSKAMLLKKKKKPVNTAVKSTDDDKVKGKAKEKVEELTKKEKEKLSMPPPPLANVA